MSPVLRCGFVRCDWRARSATIEAIAVRNCWADGHPPTWGSPPIVGQSACPRVAASSCDGTAMTCCFVCRTWSLVPFSSCRRGTSRQSSRNRSGCGCWRYCWRSVSPKSRWSAEKRKMQNKLAVLIEDVRFSPSKVHCDRINSSYPTERQCLETFSLRMKDF